MQTDILVTAKHLKSLKVNNYMYIQYMYMYACTYNFINKVVGFSLKRYEPFWPVVPTSATESSGPAAMMDPVSLHPGHQPHGRHRHLVCLLPQLQLVGKPMDVETWIWTGVRSFGEK